VHHSKPYLYSITSSARASRVGGRCIAAKSPCNKLRLPSYGTKQTDFQLLPNNNRGAWRVRKRRCGAVFQPELKLIKLMKAVLDDAAATLPESNRTSTMMAEMASQILACAAKGERDPVILKVAALLVVVECSRYSYDISPERRVV
jgi:hypothetical protein